MSSPAHSSRSVCPDRSFRLSSSRRRLGSASALNTASVCKLTSPSKYAAVWLPLTIGSQTAACQECALADWSGRGERGGEVAGAAEQPGHGDRVHVVLVADDQPVADPDD